MFRKIISVTTLSILFCNPNYSCSVVKATQSAVTTVVASPDLIKKFESLKFWSKASLPIPFLLPLLYPLFIRTFCSSPSRQVQDLIKKICSECGMDGANMHIHHTISQGGLAQGVGNGVIAIDQAAAADLDNPNNANPTFIASVPVFIRHEAGHVKEQHLLKTFWALGTVLALSYFGLEKLIEKTKLASLFAQPTTQWEYRKTVILFNLRDLVALLPAACLFFPLSRYAERRADSHAIAFTKNAVELEAAARLFEDTARYQNLQRGSFRAQYLSDPLHPCIFERIDNFRAAAQKLREQGAQQQTVKQPPITQPAAAPKFTVHVVDTITYDLRDNPSSVASTL